MVYRGTIDQVASCCLSEIDQRVAVVLALVYLKPIVAESLLHLQNRYPLSRCTYLGVDNGALSLRVGKLILIIFVRIIIAIINICKQALIRHFS